MQKSAAQASVGSVVPGADAAALDSSRGQSNVDATGKDVLEEFFAERERPKSLRKLARFIRRHWQSCALLTGAAALWILGF